MPKLRMQSGTPLILDARRVMVFESVNSIGYVVLSHSVCTTRISYVPSTTSNWIDFTGKVQEILEVQRGTLRTYVSFLEKSKAGLDFGS